MLPIRSTNVSRKVLPSRGVTTTPLLFRPLLAEVGQDTPLYPLIWSYGIDDHLEVWRKRVSIRDDLHTDGAILHRPFLVDGFHTGNYHPDLFLSFSSDQPYACHPYPRINSTDSVGAGSPTCSTNWHRS